MHGFEGGTRTYRLTRGGGAEFSISTHNSLSPTGAPINREMRCMGPLAP